MGYLKFLGWSLLGLAAVFLGSKISGHVGLIAVAASISFFWKLAPRSWALSYTLWAVLSLAWAFTFKHAAPEELAKHSASVILVAEGLWTLAGMVVLLPVCYAIGKLAMRRRPAA